MENKIIKPKNRYSAKDSKPLCFSKNNPKSVSRTQQHFAKSANINNIMKKYRTSGLLTDPSIIPTRKPMFGDFSNVGSFMEAQNLIIEVNNYFNSLPADVRMKFNNNIRELEAFIADPANAKEAQELGLFGKAEKAPVVPTEIPKEEEKEEEKTVPGEGTTS